MLFEVLHTADHRLVGDAVYHAGLRILEREYYPEWRRWLSLRPGGAAEALAIASRIIEDIEGAERKPLGDLTEQEVGPYRRCIHSIADRRCQQEHSLDRETGERLLEELRQLYGGPGGTPLARPQVMGTEAKVHVGSAE